MSNEFRANLASKLVERYDASALLIFPQNRDAVKFTSAKTFLAMLIDSDGAKLIAHRVHEEQLEEENKENYEIIYLKNGDINDILPDGRILIPSDTPYYLRKSVKRKVSVADELFRRVLRKPTDEDLAVIKEGARILDSCLAEVLGMMEIGMRESEISSMLDSLLIKRGMDGFAYRSIVASGKRTSCPLANTTDKEIEKGDVIIIDTSPIYKGFVLGVARTILTEEDAEKIMYLEIMNSAAREALKYARIGERAENMDSAARNFLAARNIDYPHYTAMPLGGFYAPYSYPGSEDILENNSAFFLTIGIYRKGFGLRLKHQIVLSEHAEILDSFAVVK